MRKPLCLIGAAFAVGGAHIGTRYAPTFIKKHTYSAHKWHTIVWQHPPHLKSFRAAVPILKKSSNQLAHQVRQIKTQFLPMIIGGDHSCAIGTWQGVIQKHPIGLLWIDAHFDSHVTGLR